MVGLSPRKEEKNIIPNSNVKPGDILVPSWMAGKPMAFDVTVTSPLQSSLIEKSASKSGAAVKNAENWKDAKLYEVCEEQGLDFTPLAFDSF